MTERKPKAATWESWIERQIEEGRRGGAFDDLEGEGRPIDGIDRPHDELWWVKSKLQREDVAVTPPTIAIRTDRDRTLAAAMAASSEREVRELIGQLNERIRDVNRFVTWGPPSSVAPLDTEAIVARWAAMPRPVLEIEPEQPEPAPVPSWRQRVLVFLRIVRPTTTR